MVRLNHPGSLPWGRWDHPGTLGSHRVTVYLSWVAGFTRVCRLVHPGSLCSLEFALGRWVLPQGATSGSLGSSGVFEFTRVRPGGRWVHPGTLGAFGFALGGVCFIWGRWVHSGAPWSSLSSSWLLGFTRVRPGDRWILSRFTRVRQGGRWVYWGSPWG